ncbi:DUF2567 domain-containing protein [Gordonia aichiensis]|uniref:DUF2567 domain-containing protein n=1 Tax=Gordonia aichiensis TaxID=36820 RepID=UPI0032655ED6
MNLRRVAAVVVALLAAAIAVAGLWVVLAPTPDLVVSHGGRLGFATEADPARLFDGVATFAFLAFGLGVLIALAAWFGLRSSRGPGGLAFVVLMSIATSGLALDLADRFGTRAHDTIDRAVPGDYRGTVNLWLDGTVGPPWLLLLCAPTAGVLIYLVCVISSAHADLGVGDLPDERSEFTPVPTDGVLPDDSAVHAVPGESAPGEIAPGGITPGESAAGDVTAGDGEPRTRR